MEKYRKQKHMNHGETEPYPAMWDATVFLIPYKEDTQNMWHNLNRILIFASELKALLDDLLSN